MSHWILHLQTYFFQIYEPLDPAPPDILLSDIRATGSCTSRHTSFRFLNLSFTHAYVLLLYLFQVTDWAIGQVHLQNVYTLGHWSGSSAECLYIEPLVRFICRMSIGFSVPKQLFCQTHSIYRFIST